MNIAIIGATDKPDRYAYLAFKLLKDLGHAVFPIHPKLKTIDDVQVFASIRDVQADIHTITLYVGSATSALLTDAILEKAPQRIIINPGAENVALEKLAQQKGIEVVRGCTLVMLKTGKFDV